MYVPVPYDYRRHFDNWAREEYMDMGDRPDRPDRPLKYKWFKTLNPDAPPEERKYERREDILRGRIEEYRDSMAHAIYESVFENHIFKDYEEFKKKFAEYMYEYFLEAEDAKANEWKQYIERNHIREDQIVNDEWIKTYKPEDGAKAFDAPSSWMEDREE